MFYLCLGHEDADRNRDFRESGLPNPPLVAHVRLWWNQSPWPTKEPAHSYPGGERGGLSAHSAKIFRCIGSAR